MKAKGKAIFYELGGFYLLYLSYSIFQNRMASTGAKYWVIIAAIILFLLSGLGLVGAGIWMIYKNKE